MGFLGDITTSAFAVSTVSSNRRFLDKYFLISIHCVSDDGDDDDDDDEDEDEDDEDDTHSSSDDPDYNALINLKALKSYIEDKQLCV